MSTKCLLFWFRRQMVLNDRAAKNEREYQLLAARLRRPRFVIV